MACPDLDWIPVSRSRSQQAQSRLAGVDVDVEREREDGEGGEEDEGVDEDGLAVGVEAAEVDVAVGARELAQQARRQQHEQHNAHHHRAPVRHRSSLLAGRPGAWESVCLGGETDGEWECVVYGWWNSGLGR